MKKPENCNLDRAVFAKRQPLPHESARGAVRGAGAAAPATGARTELGSCLVYFLLYILNIHITYKDIYKYVKLAILIIFKREIRWHQLHSPCAAITTIHLGNFFHLPKLKLSPLNSHPHSPFAIPL